MSASKFSYVVFLGGVLAFLFFLPVSFPVLWKLHMILDIPCAISTKSKSIRRNHMSGPEKGVITKGVFSLEESLVSLKYPNSLESPGMVGFTFVFHGPGVLSNL